MMDDDYYKKLINRKNELIESRQSLQELHDEKIVQLKLDLREIDKKIADCVERIKEAQTIYHKDLKFQGLVEPGFYWGRNKWRNDPDNYDLIILVKKPNRDGVQEWYMM
jgi:hypothetical protein